MLPKSGRYAIILGVAVVCIIAGYAFYKQFTLVPGVQTVCNNAYGYPIKYIPGMPITAEYKNCIERRAKFFLEKDFELTKDLAKSFLTLLAGLLVGSITFSEKIVNLHSASRMGRTLMVSCWSLLLAAIITCGVGLALMTIAAGWAAYQPFLGYHIFEERAVILFICAGLTFGGSMACLLAAGIISLYEPKIPLEE